MRPGAQLKPKPRWAHKPGSSPEGELVEEREPGEDKAIVCARCNYPITTASARMKMLGLHEHSQVNPGGYIWNFGCFVRAPGCYPEGQPSSEFAWFPGFQWQIEICRGCSLHLGWLFSSIDHQFHGLILERIFEMSGEVPPA
jgi:hypothetical protein